MFLTEGVWVFVVGGKLWADCLDNSRFSGYRGGDTWEGFLLLNRITFGEANFDLKSSTKVLLFFLSLFRGVIWCSDDELMGITETVGTCDCTGGYIGGCGGTGPLDGSFF
ncbi:MAG: hypothetical protein ACKPKO_02495, partial [Candidatus Fonsibacter sp.]